VARLPNPFRALILYIGFALARAGLIDRHRVVRTTDLAWPRIVTGIARMSKNAVDVAMVGVAVGTSAVAGVGFAGPYWGLAFALGGGVAGGTIALVSQRFGAEAYAELGDAVRASVLPRYRDHRSPSRSPSGRSRRRFIDVLSSNEAAIAFGADYLRIVGLGVPFAALNLVGSRVLVGCDDAYTAMQVRAGGAIANIVLSAAFIFGLGGGVEGAALGTVLSNVLAVAAFAVGLLRGDSPNGRVPDRDRPVRLVREPGHAPRPRRDRGSGRRAQPRVDGRGVPNARHPRRVRREHRRRVRHRPAYLGMNAPGPFGLASSSLVGQGARRRGPRRGGGVRPRHHPLFRGDVRGLRGADGRLRDDIVALFAESPESPEVPIAITFVYAACVAVVFQGIRWSGGGRSTRPATRRSPSRASSSACSACRFRWRTSGVRGDAPPSTCRGSA